MKIILIFIDQYPKFSELNHSKTALAYSFLSKKNYTDGKYTNDLATIIEGNVQPYYSNFFNAFSDVYLDVFCDIKNPFTSLNNMGIFKFCVAGSVLSGLTLFNATPSPLIGFGSNCGCLGSYSEICTNAPFHSLTISLYGNAIPDLSEIA